MTTPEEFGSAPTIALQEKFGEWLKDNINSPVSEFMSWAQGAVSAPRSGLTNRQRREWTNEKRRQLARDRDEFSAYLK
jgi:hypothetical protein